MWGLKWQQQFEIEACKHRCSESSKHFTAATGRNVHEISSNNWYFNLASKTSAFLEKPT